MAFFEYFASKLACDRTHTALADKRTKSRGHQGCTEKCVSPRDSDDCGSQDLGEWLSFKCFASFASKLAWDRTLTALADKRTNSRSRQDCTKKCVSPRDSDDCSEQLQELGEWLSVASNSV